MTLHDLCEPLFQVVCRINRSARKGLPLDFHQVRAEVKAMLADMKLRSNSMPGVAEQFDKVELPLIFFADSMISESSVNFARMWDNQRLAEELNPPQLGGDERFFDLLDEALADRSPGAAERLQIFYTCLGLGFTGFYTGQPEFLRRKMNEILSRLKNSGEVELTSRVCPETYENVNTSDLVEPPGVKLMGWMIGVVGLILIVLIANFALFQTGKSKLDRELDAIIATAAPSASESTETEDSR